MRITAIQTYKLTFPTDCWLLVSVETDEGITGWGEVTGSLDDEGLAGILQRYGDWAAGKDPLHIEACMAYFKEWTYPVSANVRTYATARSGIDQALWDIAAKYRGLPLYQLLGGCGKRAVPLYANLNKALRADRSLDRLAENARQALQEGFRMLKCTPFDEISPDRCDCLLDEAMERVDAVAAAAGIGQVAIDCHQRFQRHTLSRMVGRVLERYGQPYWIEDPVDAADFDTMRLMHQCYPGVRWAAGEDAFTVRQLHNEVVSDCYEVLMPDVKYIGGPSVVRAVIPYLEALGLKVSIHNPNGIIATAHSAHLTALCGSDMPMEFPYAAVPQREQLCSKPEQVRDGMYLLPDRPGIGVALSREAMREHAKVFCNGCWQPYK